MFRCSGSYACLDLIHHCDGDEHCLMGDDEWFCDLSCPTMCTCETLAYLCTEANLHAVPTQVSTWARLLDLSHNKVSLRNTTLTKFTMLSSLDLSYNSISELKPGTFNTLVNLKSLDLSYNEFTVLPDGSFNGLSALISLHLAGNPIKQILPGALASLLSIENLSL